jgi:hypothetical protein
MRWRSPIGSARLHGSSCCSIGMLALAEMAGPVDLHVVHPMSGSKASEQHR